MLAVKNFTVGQFFKICFWLVVLAAIAGHETVLVVTLAVCVFVFVIALIHATIDRWIDNARADAEEAIRRFRSS